MNHTEASLAQRRRNVKEIAKRKRAKDTCKWGHKNQWSWMKDGRRRCLVCNRLRTWYYERGIPIPPGGPV